MSIDLRRRYVGMAKQFLHDAQIRAVMQEVACEGMAQHRRTDAGRGNPGGSGAGLEIAGESLARVVAARAAGRKEPRSSREAGVRPCESRTIGCIARRASVVRGTIR